MIWSFGLGYLLVQEALRVHEKMVAAGQPPNTTTFNALISGERKFKVFQHGMDAADLALPEWC